MTILQSGYPNLLGFSGKQLFNKSVAVRVLCGLVVVTF